MHYSEYYAWQHSFTISLYYTKNIFLTVKVKVKKKQKQKKKFITGPCYGEENIQTYLVFI